MPSFADTADLAIRELDACRGVLLRATTADWARPTPCEGWDVEALARHLAAVAWQQAEAFHRARVGVTEAPSWLALGGDTGSLLDALSVTRDHLANALDAVSSIDDAVVPLPFATLPASIAASALVLEYGVHRADLDRAIVGRADDALDPSVAAEVVGLLGALLPFIATKPPATPLTYRLVADTATIAVTSNENGWQAGEGGDEVCELRGNDASIALVSLGRIPVDHPSLTVTDPSGSAPAFTHHIPGL